MIGMANREKKGKKIENVEFSVDDAYLLPFDQNMFDTLICVNSLHFMIES